MVETNDNSTSKEGIQSDRENRALHNFARLLGRLIAQQWLAERSAESTNCPRSDPSQTEESPSNDGVP